MRFIADRMLGKLALYLRMLGYDTVYMREKDAAGMIERAQAEQRTVLTRDTKIARVNTVPVLFIDTDTPAQQLKEVLKHFALQPEVERWFSLCLRCNALLVSVSAQEVDHLVPAYVIAAHKDFSQCPQCRRVYWRGTHRERMEERIRKVIGAMRTT